MNLFDIIDRFKQRKVHPQCSSRGRVCAHCETEIAEQAAFVISEQLTTRAKELVEKQPDIAQELNRLATEIQRGSWFEEFDATRNL